MTDDLVPGYDLAWWRQRIPLFAANTIPMNACSHAPQTSVTRAAAERYLASFPPGVVEFPVVGMDVLEVHLHSAALPGGAGGSGLGYGATAEEARTGALGEMAEMVLSAAALQPRPRVQASHAELVTREGADRVQESAQRRMEAGSATPRSRRSSSRPASTSTSG